MKVVGEWFDVKVVKAKLHGRVIMSKEETKFKPGDIVKTDCIYRIIGSSMQRIKLDESIEFEIVKAQKTSTHNASYVVKNVDTQEIEKTQYWEDELWKAWGDR